MEIAIMKLLDGRRGKNTRHELGRLFAQAVFSRLSGYEDVNDAERLARDPPWAIVGGARLDRAAASSSQMGRFETAWLATDANHKTLADLSGNWIDQIHDRKPSRSIVLNRTAPRARPIASKRVRPGTVMVSIRSAVSGPVSAAARRKRKPRHARAAQIIADRRPRPSARAITRSLIPQACFRRRTSRTWRIGSLLAGMALPASIETGATLRR
jgi:hypothetical protein